LPDDPFLPLAARVDQFIHKEGRFSKPIIISAGLLLPQALHPMKTSFDPSDEDGQLDLFVPKMRLFDVHSLIISIFFDKSRGKMSY
jgi:hypothetical protein